MGIGLRRRFVLDAGPFILLFTNEKGSDTVQRLVLMHERGELEVFIHPNNLAEAYRVISRVRMERPEMLIKDIDPETVIRSAYTTLNVAQDVESTICLGELMVKYRNKPWGDLSSASLALSMSDEERVTVIILDDERHFEELIEVESLKISDLKNMVHQDNSQL